MKTFFFSLTFLALSTYANEQNDSYLKTVREVLIAHTNQFKSCEQSVNKNSLPTHSSFNFIIGSDGIVAKAHVIPEFITQETNETSKCMTKILSRITFPKPIAQEVIEVSHQIDFSGK